MMPTCRHPRVTIYNDEDGAGMRHAVCVTCHHAFVLSDPVAPMDVCRGCGCRCDARFQVEAFDGTPLCPECFDADFRDC